MSESVDWDEFERRFRWKQGEHIVAIAPTEAGKTTLMLKLLPYRGANLFFGTKLKDPAYDYMLQHMGYTRVDHLSEIRPWHSNKILLWPHLTAKTVRGNMQIQHDAFEEALNDIATKGKPWTLWLDEAKYAAENLGLKMPITYCVEQLRTVGGTVVCGGQRPAYLPKSVITNASHAFLWKSANRDDAQVLSDMGGIDARAVRDEMLTLGKHEMLYIHTRGTQSTVLRTEVKKGASVARTH